MKEKIIESFTNSKGFIKNNDFKIIDLLEDKCIMEYSIKENGLNPYQIVHGGVLFGLADSCAGALAFMSGKAPLTTSANINYLNKAKGKKLKAVSKPLKVGKNIGYYVVDIYDENDNLVVQANINMYLTNIE